MSTKECRETCDVYKDWCRLRSLLNDVLAIHMTHYGGTAGIVSKDYLDCIREQMKVSKGYLDSIRGQLKEGEK